MRSPLSATSASLRRHSALLNVDSDGLAMDSDLLAPHSGPARGRFGGSQRARVPSRRAFNRSSTGFGPACRRFGGGCRPFRPTQTRYNRSRLAFRTALVDSKGPRNPFSRSRHPFRLGLTLAHGSSAIDRQQLLHRWLLQHPADPQLHRPPFTRPIWAAILAQVPQFSGLFLPIYWGLPKSAPRFLHYIFHHPRTSRQPQPEVRQQRRHVRIRLRHRPKTQRQLPIPSLDPRVSRF